LPDRINLGFFGFVLATAILTIVLYDFTDLQSQTGFWATIAGYLLLGIPQTIIFVFPAYWAFSIRRALAIRLYRNQALGIALVAISFLVFGEVISTLTTYNLALVVIFYWLDASVLAARRSDPLLRDTLHWTKLRIVIWAIVLISLVVSTAFVLINRDITYIPSDPLWSEVATSPDFAIPVIALIILPLVARRSKDPALRKHLIWFGTFAVGQFVSILGAYVIGGASYFVGFAFGGYFLFRSVSSLVPLNRVSLAGLDSLTVNVAGLGPGISVGHPNNPA
jgi:hypothetical protein